MKLYCRGEYHNGPMDLHFSGPGMIEVDDWKGEYLLRDAPDNFTTELPAQMTLTEVKSFAEPPRDKAVRSPRVKK